MRFDYELNFVSYKTITGMEERLTLLEPRAK